MHRNRLRSMSAIVTRSVLRVCRPSVSEPAQAQRMKALKFEVHGRVQGVFFRANTTEQAEQLGLAGWCRNTSSGTVEGEVQGSAEKVASMKDWLQNVGSPGSRIDKLDTTEEDIPHATYDSFNVRRD